MVALLSLSLEFGLGLGVRKTPAEATCSRISFFSDLSKVSCAPLCTNYDDRVRQLRDSRLRRSAAQMCVSNFWDC